MSTIFVSHQFIQTALDEQPHKNKTCHAIDGVPIAGHAPSFPVEKIGLLPRKNGSWTRRRSVGRSWGLKRLRIGMKWCSRNIRDHVDSERVKLTAFCIAAIATLPRTSFPDNNFASCLLPFQLILRRWNLSSSHQPRHAASRGRLEVGSKNQK